MTMTTIMGPRTGMGPVMAAKTPLDHGGLYRLMAWMSPAFPVGAFAYSHGLECAVDRGLVRDRKTLSGWVEAIVCRGAGAVDAVLFREAWIAAAANDLDALERIAEMGTALRASAETALESEAQGGAFLDTVAAAWSDPGLLDWSERLRGGGRIPAATKYWPRGFARGGGAQPPYAVAVGAAAGRMGLPLEFAVFAFIQTFAVNLVSAGVRLLPLGQTDGQRIVAGLEGAITAAAGAALAHPLEDMGAATPMVDWTSMLHETQYTRLFRS